MAAPLFNVPKQESDHSGLLAFIALAIIPIATILDGYALSVLWRWFIVKQFALAPLTIPMALGIATMVRTIIQPPEHESDPDDSPGTRFAKLVGLVILRPLFTLAFAWVVTLFM